LLIKEFLENVCNEIKYKPIREDISEELSLHIEEQKDEYIKKGFEERIAEEKAVSNMGEAQEIGKKLNKIHKPKFDWILTLLVAILIGFGFLITIIKEQKTQNYCLEQHIIYFILGIILCIGIYFLDYRRILKYPKLIYGISTIVILTTLFFGHECLGRKYLWFARNVDPTNICILLYIISFVGFIKNLNSKYININIGKINFKFRVDILMLAGLSLFSIFIISSLNHIAMALILAFSYIIITTAHIAKLPNIKASLIKFYGILFALAIILILSILFTQNGIYSRLQRGIIALYSNDDPRGIGWVNIIIGNVLENSNMFSGVEMDDVILEYFGDGTDFPLISLIANCGSVYTAIVIMAVILLAIKIILDCKNIRDETGRLLVIGLGSFILLQALFNILMSFNLIPIIGLNLPFVSYGLNGLVVNMMMIAFILSIYRRKDILTKKVGNDKKLKIKVTFE